MHRSLGGIGRGGFGFGGRDWSQERFHAGVGKIGRTGTNSSPKETNTAGHRKSIRSRSQPGMSGGYVNDGLHAAKVRAA
jgi:hypothetical protein